MAAKRMNEGRPPDVFTMSFLLKYTPAGQVWASTNFYDWAPPVPAVGDYVDVDMSHASRDNHELGGDSQDGATYRVTERSWGFSTDTDSLGEKRNSVSVTLTIEEVP